MSKLFNEFKKLKKENPEKLYLLKSGIFYVALNEDADKLSELFDFKITKLNDSVTKCGFPEKRLEFYTRLLKTCSINFEIIDSPIKTINNNIEYANNKQIQQILKTIHELDMDTISFKDAFQLLQRLNNKVKTLELFKATNTNEEKK